MIIIYYHVAVFVAQGKTPFDESILEDAGHFTRTVMAYKGIECVEVCVRPDHVHLLLKVPAKADVFTAIETLQYWLQDFVARNSSQPPFQWDHRLWNHQVFSSHAIQEGAEFVRQTRLNCQW